MGFPEGHRTGEHQEEGVMLSWARSRHHGLWQGSESIPVTFYVISNLGAKSRAILTDTSVSDGSITVVAKIQLDAKVVLCVFCATEAIFILSYIFWGFPPFS